MLLATSVFTIICAFRWGDWKNWRKYHPTMLFIAMSDLLYYYLYEGHYLWTYKPLFIQKNFIPALLATFIIMPLTGLIFLTNYPETWKGLLVKVAKYTAIYITFEEFFVLLGTIIHRRGWNIWWSLLWDLVMFPIWALHYKKPLLAYPAGAAVVILMLVIFPI